MDPIKIYWEEFPESDKQLKEAINDKTTNRTGKILNSTEVVLVKDLHDKKNQKLTTMNKKIVKEERRRIPPQKEDLPKSAAALKDLSASEKQKIARLVHELAKYGDEKKAAVEELETVKSQYDASLKKLQAEKEQAIKKHDQLKEKLLEYEILIDEIKQSSKFANDMDCVEHVVSETIQPVTKEIAVSQGDVEKKIFHDFSDLFVEQEKKFRLQQEQLQKQIEQVQRLQGSLMQQRSHDIRNIEQNETLTSEVGMNTKKLESYISSEQNQSRTFMETPVSSSYLKEKEKTPKPDIKEGADSIRLGSSSKVRSRTIDSSITQKTNLHTEVKSDTSHVLFTPKSISHITESVTLPKTPVTPKTKSHNMEPVTLPRTSKTQASKIDSHLSFRSSSPPFRDTIEKVTGDVLVSPVQRKHFKPSSIIELVDGLQPRSTSTSVDQYSLQSGRNTQRKSVTQKSSSALRNAYTSKPSAPRRRKSSIDTDAMEKDMLEDIFFI